jgi:hypothetical protein
MPRAKREFVDRKAATRAAGAEIVPLDGLELDFFVRKRTTSCYDKLLEQLLDAPKGSALKVARLSARASILKRAQKKGLNAEFAEHVGSLYVRLVPSGKPEAKQPAGNSLSSVRSAVVKVLARAFAGPLSSKQIASVAILAINEVEAELDNLVAEGKVERDGKGGGPVFYRMIGAGSGTVKK